MKKLLLLGDIVGASGRRCAVRYIRENPHDFVVVNGENSAGGIGITPRVADQLLDAGVDVITSGNHVWAHREIYPYLDSCGGRLLRPENCPPGNPGTGFVTRKTGGVSVMVLNLQGRVFMPGSDCPFRAADRVLSGGCADIVIVDFHAEATSEKIALGRYLDGRATVVAGTHTHVQTADASILPGGTAYITDLGMCGSSSGVIGVNFSEVRERFLTGRPVRLSVSEGDDRVCGLSVTLGPDMKPSSVETVNARI